MYFHFPEVNENCLNLLTPDGKEILEYTLGGPTIPLLIQNLWWLSIQQRGQSTFTSIWGGTLCLKICCCLVVIIPCCYTLLLLCVHLTVQSCREVTLSWLLPQVILSFQRRPHRWVAQLEAGFLPLRSLEIT